jgi:tRNA1(Val) A37 N6-methylase TrmN6
LKTTKDLFLGGQLTLTQPSTGYRAGSDAVLLAAAVAAGPGDRVLDMGCGVGTAGLCLAQRLAGIRLTGIDADPALLALARQNATQNGLADEVSFLDVDVIGGVPDDFVGGFDHVMANPPYFAAGQAQISPDPQRARARSDPAENLTAWVRFAVACLTIAGRLVFIHRRERAEEIATLLADSDCRPHIVPLIARPGRPPKRVLISAARANKGAATWADPLVVHDQTGAYSALFEGVLRHGQALPI